jgi:hypothetical protein
VRYSGRAPGAIATTFGETWDRFEQDGPAFWTQMNDLLDLLEHAVSESEHV